MNVKYFDFFTFKLSVPMLFKFGSCLSYLVWSGFSIFLDVVGFKTAMFTHTSIRFFYFVLFFYFSFPDFFSLFDFSPVSFNSSVGFLVFLFFFTVLV